MAEMMAGKWISFVTVVCFLLGCTQHGLASQLNCQYLKQTFPNCACSVVPNTVDNIVDCSNRGLTATPTIENPYTKTIYKLDLSNNSIRSLTKDSFLGLKIENLDLTGNKLQSVDNDTFNSMENNLNSLIIEGDGTGFPPVGTLKQVSTIEHLTMRNYNVVDLESHHELFLSFVNLKSLTVDNWRLNSIEGRSFLGLNNLQSLSIINEMGLETLPTYVLREEPFVKTLLTLQISRTKIQSIGHSAFEKLDVLKTLDLSKNEIHQLEPNCFLKVEDTLENINLHGNLLNNQVFEGHIRIAGLSRMTALKELDLSFNTFGTIPELPNLAANQPVSLILNNNEITQLQENAFSGYAQQVKDLFLKENKISGMHENSFQGVTQLNSLYVDAQKLVVTPLRLPLSITNSASTLHTLSAKGQPVTPESLWKVVKLSTSLQALYLSGTDLASIPDFVFENVTSLKTLDLGHNRLHKLTQKSLAGLRQLETLYLVNNYITTISSCVYHEFESPKITMDLNSVGIKCDCNIEQFIRDIKSGRIVQEGGKCSNGQPLTLVDPNSLVCDDPAYIVPPCEELYTTPPAPTTQIPVSNPTPILVVNVVEVTKTTLRATWSLTNKQDLKSFTFEVHVPSTGVREFVRNNLPTYKAEEVATGLDAGTTVSVCVTAVFNTRNNIQKCVQNKTLSKTPIKQSQDDDSSASTNTAIIVGCVVAGVGLIGIVIAVIVLLVFRKRPKKAPDSYTAPTQPRNFAKAELPTMTDNSRSFQKPKPKANGKRAHSEGMQVVAISDGQTSPGHRVGRVNMMFQHDEGGYEPMSNYKKQRGSSSTYENDHGALPPTPGQDSRPPSYPGYYNDGFRDDKYDEIEVAI